MSFAFYQDFRETLCSKTTLEVQVSGSSIQCWRCVARVKFSVRRVFLSFKLTGVSNLMDCFCFYGYQSFSGIPQFHSIGSLVKNCKVTRPHSFIFKMDRHVLNLYVIIFSCSPNIRDIIHNKQQYSLKNNLKKLLYL